MRYISALLVTCIDQIAGDGYLDDALGHMSLYFDEEALGKMAADLSMKSRGDTYHRVDYVPHCDFGTLNGEMIAPLDDSIGHHFPGGISEISKNSSLWRVIEDLLGNFKGFDASQLQASRLVSATSATMAKHIVDAALASLLSTVPPSVPPPIWNNEPLPCMPLPTDHPCSGSIKYPITFADFTMSGVTSSIMEGVRASFPGLFASRAGKTPGGIYKDCYSAYMSMQCASMFPMCTVPQALDMPVPGVGSVPLCGALCRNVLAQCPGFSLGDIGGPCDTSSVPPICAMAHYSRIDDMPPQYSSFDQYQPFSRECPPLDPELVFAGDHSLLAAINKSKKN